MPTPGRPVPHCRAGAKRGVARRLTLQERRSPGEPQHPRVAEIYARINDKLRAADKRMFGEAAESFSVFDLTKVAITELLLYRHTLVGPYRGDLLHVPGFDVLVELC